MKRIALVSLWVLAGCPDQGVVCRTGTERCGVGCADFTTDSRNCGACGQACASTQVCVSSACQCRAGTALCDGQCVVLENDPKNCGACAQRCTGTNPFCQAGSCNGSGCSGNAVPCDGGACVAIGNDPLNCGGCGIVCPDSQSCRDGQCRWDLVAACFTTGQVVGVQSGTEQRGPLMPLGSAPASLAQYGQVLLSVDGIDSRLVQARLPSLQQLSEFNATGRGPNHVLVDAPYVYSVNSVGHTLQVLVPVGDAGCPAAVPPDAGCAYATLGNGSSVRPLGADAGCFYPEARALDAGCVDTQLADGGLGPLTLGDAGCFWPPLPPAAPGMPCFQQPSDAGLKLLTIGELDTGAGTFPEAVVKSNGALWVPLNSTGEVLKIDISNPRLPAVVATVSLNSLDLMTYDGGMSAPMPFFITEHLGKLYLPLNNLNPITYEPGGPGLLAVIDPATNAASTINLGPSGCLNAGFVLSAGGKLFVSCFGAVRYDSSFAVIGTDQAGVLMLDTATGARAMWNPQCGAGDGGCRPILLSRLAVRDGRVYLGDQNGGRIFVADIADGGFTERRGYATAALGAPIQACGVSGNYSNVADILSLP